MSHPVYPAHIADDLRPPTLGELIRRQRELAALPLRQVAAAVGISNAYLSQIEPNLREPSERVLGAIADQLGLSLDILIAEGNRARSDDGLTEPASVRCHPLATSEQYPVHHPLDPSLAGVTMAQLSAPAHSPANHRRNAVTMSTGQSSWDSPNSFIGCIDRSPCGTETSARRATMYARGELGIGEDFRHESVTGTVFTGRILDTVKLGDVDASCPRSPATAGSPYLRNYVLDPTDRFPTGLTVADIWCG